MKEQASDESIQLLLRQFHIQNPKRKCPSGNQIVNICISPTCQSNAIFCFDQDCNYCSKAHIYCENVYIRSFTQLLKKRAEGQRQFIIKIFEIQNSMIQQIQRRRKAIVQKFYLGDLQTKYLKVIESLYLKKDDFQLKSSLAEQTYGVLKKTLKEVAQPDKQLLETFENEVANIINNLNATQTKLIEQYIKKSKNKAEVNLLQGSTIVTKENTGYLKFLKESFPGVKRFELIFKASQNGFEAAKFHQHCDNIRHTFTLIKTQFGKVIGGYTPLKWNEIQGTGYVADSQNLSFLLSFNLGQKMRVTQPESAICNNPNCGPIFGSGHDICIRDKCNQSNTSSTGFAQSYNCNGMYSRNQQAFTAFGGNANGNRFRVTQYEVYRVIW